MSFFLSSCHYIEPHCFIVHIVDGSYKKHSLKGALCGFEIRTELQYLQY